MPLDRCQGLIDRDCSFYDSSGPLDDCTASDGLIVRHLASCCPKIGCRTTAAGMRVLPMQFFVCASIHSAEHDSKSALLVSTGPRNVVCPLHACANSVSNWTGHLACLVLLASKRPTTAVSSAHGTVCWACWLVCVHHIRRPFTSSQLKSRCALAPKAIHEPHRVQYCDHSLGRWRQYGFPFFVEKTALREISSNTCFFLSLSRTHRPDRFQSSLWLQETEWRFSLLPLHGLREDSLQWTQISFSGTSPL